MLPAEICAHNLVGGYVALTSLSRLEPGAGHRREDQAGPPTGTPNYSALSIAVYTNVNAALAGSTSPSAALFAAQSQANTALTSAAGGL